MTKRPENVKCENCVFWQQTRNKSEWGACRRTYLLSQNDIPLQHGQHDFCGDFRSSWPEEAR